MFERIKAIIEKQKIRKLLDILEFKGTFSKNYSGIHRENEEVTSLDGVNVFYHQGCKTEDEFIEKMEISNYFLNMELNLEKEHLKKYRRASTWFIQSEGFRKKILHFYFDYLLPFSERKSFFEVYMLHKKYTKIK